MLSKEETKIPEAVNPDIQEERNSSSFDKVALSKVFYGTENYYRKKRIEQIIFKEPSLKNSWQGWDKGRRELYDSAVYKGVKLQELAVEHSWNLEEFLAASLIAGYNNSFILSLLMFQPALEMLGTDEQRKKWIPLTQSLNVIGCYAQTEMSHGTNLKNLGTTAIYNPVKQEFEINCPFPNGIKYWAGGMGKTANVALVMAHTHSLGKNCGLQAFLVPIRDLETHQPLSGVTLGDIGPKLGINWNDNGYMYLNNVKIPRTNMLMRHVEIGTDGHFKQLLPPQVVYGAMVLVRVTIIGKVMNFIAQAVTIAVRYSVVRRQCELEPGAKEPKVLDYVAQQHKIFPILAFGYGLGFVYSETKKLYDDIIPNEKYGDFQTLHIVACTMKAFVSDLGAEAMETCRRACGGHGFLMASGIAVNLPDVIAATTYEGENTVLYLQVAKFLMKSFQMRRSGRKLSGMWAYLNHIPNKCTMDRKEDALDLGQMVQCFKHMSYKMIEIAAKLLEKSVTSGKALHDAFNQHQVQLIGAARAYGELHFLRIYVKCVMSQSDNSIKTVLTRLCQLHALNRIYSNADKFIMSGTINAEQLQMVQMQMLDLLALIRPDAVNLVDAFDYSDDTLNSALGAYDGNVYERLLHATHYSSLNDKEVQPAFHKYIKPFRNNQAKL